MRIRRLKGAVFASAAMVLVSLLGAGRVSAGEILLNGGFETGSLSAWFQDRNFGGSENWNVTSSVAHSGTFSATNFGNMEIRQNFVAVATSEITSVSFWAKHDPAAASLLAVDFFYSDNTDNQFTVTTSGLDWNFFDVTSQLLSGKNLVGFSIFGNSGGRTWFDDASIQTAAAAVPVPGSLAVLFSGALVVAPVVYLRNYRNKKAIATS